MPNKDSRNESGEVVPVIVQVTAPATLPEGFQFDATFENKTFSVTVVSILKNGIFSSD